MTEKLAQLPIEYDYNAQTGVVTDDALWTLILLRLFPSMKIIFSHTTKPLEDLDLGENVYRIGLPAKKEETAVKTILQSKKFIEFTKANPKIKFDMYSPIDPPYKVNPLMLLMNSPTIAHAYENKRYFRDEFDDLIRIPEYCFKYVDELDKAAAYRELKEEYGKFVLQDEESFGSKGTYIISDYEDFTDAVHALKKKSSGRAIVISKFVEGINASIQVCVTKYGVFSGGVQRQLINSKYLCNPRLEGGAKWCGGEMGGDFPDIVQHQAQEIASIIGSELSSHGYKGIFGVDLIITPDNNVYAIEINARHTGYSHIISDMQLLNGKIPFMLLHFLELGNFKYEVQDMDALPSSSRHKKPVSFMIINNPLSEEFNLKKYIRPGVYRYKDGKVEFVKPGYTLDHLKSDDSFLLFSKYNEGDVVGKGKRIVKITKFGKSMGKTDINAKTQELVAAIKKEFELPE